jgi:hypothetical protein
MLYKQTPQFTQALSKNQMRTAAMRTAVDALLFVAQQSKTEQQFAEVKEIAAQFQCDLSLDIASGIAAAEGENLLRAAGLLDDATKCGTTAVISEPQTRSAAELLEVYSQWRAHTRAMFKDFSRDAKANLDLGTVTPEVAIRLSVAQGFEALFNNPPSNIKDAADRATACENCTHCAHLTGAFAFCGQHRVVAIYGCPPDSQQARAEVCHGDLYLPIAGYIAPKPAAPTYTDPLKST